MNRPAALLACALLALPTFSHAQVPASAPASTPAAAPDVRPALLRQLDGEWTMTGDVRGKPVTYRMVAGPALQGTFTEMRMKDVQVPAQYEAAVFVGVDAAGKTVLAHWMDSFGAQYSIPHGTGQIAGDTIEFTIPYASGPFRNTWRYDAATASWRFALEAAQKDGSWKHFARYEVKRN